MTYDEADDVEPVAMTGDLLFWGYAALLAYLPVRRAVLRAAGRRASGSAVTDSAVTDSAVTDRER